ncbi:MAG: hypothetical protein J0M12_09505 [Deltaproteobacteria bacterium]|nr:hypothetical protein [Deltaproteobacteria bacterium]
MSLDPTAAQSSAQSTTADAVSAFENYGYGDLRPLLDDAPHRQMLALTRIAQLAADGAVLSLEQVSDAVTVAIALLDPSSERRSPEPAVRLHAVLALRAIGSQPRVIAAISDEVRESAFSVLACIPTGRKAQFDTLRDIPTAEGAKMQEPDSSVRNLCESVAGLFSRAHVSALRSPTALTADPSEQVPGSKAEPN